MAGEFVNSFDDWSSDGWRSVVPSGCPACGFEDCPDSAAWCRNAFVFGDVARGHECGSHRGSVRSVDLAPGMVVERSGLFERVDRVSDDGCSVRVEATLLSREDGHEPRGDGRVVWFAGSGSVQSHVWFAGR